MQIKNAALCLLALGVLAFLVINAHRGNISPERSPIVDQHLEQEPPLLEAVTETPTEPNSAVAKPSGQPETKEVAESFRNFGDMIASLKALADSGRADAKYQLAVQIHRCAGVMLALNYQVQHAPDEKSLDAVKTQMAGDLESCSGYRKEWRQWIIDEMASAAEMGNLEAQINYGLYADPAILIERPDQLRTIAQEQLRYQQNTLRFAQNAFRHDPHRGAIALFTFFEDERFGSIDRVQALGWLEVASMYGNVDPSAISRRRARLSPEQLNSVDQFVQNHRRNKAQANS